jgi:hypothetical protein
MEPWNGEEGLVLKSDFDRPQSVAAHCPAEEVFGKVTSKKGAPLARRPLIHGA